MTPTRQYSKNTKCPADNRFEFECKQAGYRLIAGLDEVGRGCLAGPVVAAAVILPQKPFEIEIYDSKMIPPKRRYELAKLIEDEAIAIGVGVVSNFDIDEINILEATKKAMKVAVENLSISPDFLLIDGNFPIPSDIPQRSIPSGDKLCCSIAAASIIAKVMRDDLMTAYHEEYPQYNFAQNKGYGTGEHLSAIKVYGPCPIHRFTFNGV